MSQESLKSVNNRERRQFIGGSDARTIMGKDEAALLRLWHEKRGEVEPEDLSGNLIVQLGVVTEPLNRHWFERNTGHVLTGVQRRVQHPVVRWMAATLDTSSPGPNDGCSIRSCAGSPPPSTAWSRPPGRCSKPNSCCRGRSRKR